MSATTVPSFSEASFNTPSHGSNATNGNDLAMKRLLQAKRERIRTMPLVERAVIAENEDMLIQRWAMARQNMHWHKDIGQFYQGQQELFELLSVASFEQVVEVANVPVALFGLTLPSTDDIVFEQPRQHPQAEASSAEVQRMLATRLHCLQVNEQEALSLFDLKTSAKRIAKYMPNELHYLSYDPQCSSRLAVTIDYFKGCAFTPTSSTRRKVFSVCCRRQVH